MLLPLKCVDLRLIVCYFYLVHDKVIRFFEKCCVTYDLAKCQPTVTRGKLVVAMFALIERYLENIYVIKRHL